MGRSESKQSFQDSQAAARQSGANAAAAFGQLGPAIGNFQQGVKNYLDWSNAEFAPGGEFEKDTTAELASANSGGQNSTQDYMTNLGLRTGSGTTPQMVRAAQEDDREGRRQMSQRLLGANQQRIAAMGHGLEYAANALGNVPEMWNRAYGTSVGGQGSALQSESNSARTPGFWDSFLPAFVQGAGTAAAGA